jgi:predicted nuclease of restriction endonuclease-like (RecB) superfamily
MKEIKNYAKVLDVLKEMISAYFTGAKQKTNAELLDFYIGLGSVLLKADWEEGWKSRAVMRLAEDLKKEFPVLTNFNERNLRLIQAFAAGYAPEFRHSNEHDGSGVLEICRKLSWYHHTVLLDKLVNLDERLFYMKRAIGNGWSAQVMRLQIEKKLYQRQGEAMNNFAETMPGDEAGAAKGMFRSPYIFDFMVPEQQQSERQLELGLIANLKAFMDTLGRGFAYVGNQVTLRVADTRYYLDLLFYNVHLHCYVVVELKVDAFIPEYIGKLNFYVNKVDEAIRGKGDNPTIGILLCRAPNEAIVQYALRNITSPIGVAEYEFAPVMQET